MQFVADNTGGAVLDARDWDPDDSSSSEALADDFEQLVRQAIASSPRIVECPACPGDFDGNGVVDGADFGKLLSEWGICSGCASDLDGDGVVSGADLGTLLTNWGSCF